MMDEMRDDDRSPLDVPAPRSLRVFFLPLDGKRHAVLSFDLPDEDIPASMTGAERAVLTLLLGGRSNADIARTRRTSPRTVANQIAAIYKKLGVSSRRELAVRL